ncbi:FixH family protein [Fretibacter rubidus]|uniref:FixH family protein n=1 Tax=Fretibacter rubidus TaxID=570162 RepID=UPI00352B0743
MAEMKKEKQLTGKHVLMMVVGFFALIVGVNAVFIVKAVESFSGEDVKQSYRQGLEYNKTLAARAAQADLGWRVAANIVLVDSRSHELIIQLEDKDAAPLNDLSFTAKLRNPIDLSKDHEINFRGYGQGRYKAQIDGLSGQWQLQATAMRGENSFRFEHDVRLP